MPKEIFLQIINERLYFEFIIILISYFIVNWAVFKLNFQILGMKIEFFKILPGILLIVLYNIFGKQIFSNVVVYISILIGIEIILVKLIGGIALSWLRVLWSVIFVVFLTGIGVLIIETPLSLQPAIARFITKTPTGAPFGAAIEGIFPLVTLFLLKTIDISIVPPVKRRVSLLKIGSLIIFVIPFIWLYQGSMQTLKNLEVYTPLEILRDLLMQFLLAGGLLFTYYWVFITTREQRERDRRAYEAELRRLEEVQRRLEDQRRYELKLQMERERAAQLEAEKNQISLLYDQLKSSKISPQEAKNTVLSIIDMIQTSARETLELQKTYIDSEQNLSSLDLHLTSKEKDVIRLLLDGKNTRDIASILDNSEKRIQNIVSRIYKKIGVTDRTQLVLFVMKHNLNLDNPE